MTRIAPCVLIALVVVVAACDSGGPETAGPDGFDPSEIDYDRIESLDYDTMVQPLLAARNVLAPAATDAPGDPADYGWMDVLMAGPSGFVVPFDGEGSLLVRFVEDLPAGADIPFPNLRTLDADELRFLKRWIEAGARRGEAVPFADATDLLFAGVQAENHVAILDASTLRIVRRVSFDDLGIPSAPYGPHHFAFEPDGSSWYVSLVSAGVVVKLSMDLSLDPSDPAVVQGRTEPGVFATPGMLALDPSSKRLFVGRSTLSDPLATGFGILDRTTMDLEVIATPFNVPHAMTVTPDGRYALTAELTGTRAGSRVAVYDTQSGDLSLVAVPSGATPKEFIHFALLGVHHGMMSTSAMAGMATGETADHGSMDHDTMDHDTMDHASMGHTEADHRQHMASAGYPYTATLTSRSTDEVLFFTLTEAGELTLSGTAPAGRGPYHAHASHDGTTLLVPDQRGDALSILDAVSREIVRTVAASAPGGPLSQPHSPAPSMTDGRFFVTSSNLNGKWVPTWRFLGPPTAGGAREPLPASSFGNLAAFTAEGALLDVVQLGAYPSGLEPFMRGATAGSGGHAGHGDAP